MKLSIVLPTYNVGIYIERCLRSCMQQTYVDIEIIVVDDRGQDDSIRKAELLSYTDSRIRIVRNEKNMGTYHARRVGVQHAAGDYILFLDPDDELAPNAAERLVSTLREQQDLILFCSRSIPELKPWQLHSSVPNLLNEYDQDVILKSILKCEAFRYGTEGKLIRRDVLLDAYHKLNVCEKERLVYGEDKLLFYSVLSCANAVTSIPDRLYVYHRNATSITGGDSVESLSYKIDQLGTVWSFLKNLSFGESDCWQHAKSRFLNDIRADQLRLISMGALKYSERVLVYYNIARLSRRCRDYVKLAVLVASLGRFSF